MTEISFHVHQTDVSQHFNSVSIYVPILPGNRFLDEKEERINQDWNLFTYFFSLSFILFHFISSFFLSESHEFSFGHNQLPYKETQRCDKSFGGTTNQRHDTHC